MGSPISIDHKNKTVKLDSSELLEFDHLIIAMGSVTADFGVPGVSENGLGMKTVAEAIQIRAEVMRRFEDLARFEDETRLSIAVVGGGPTGVEMAGALAELKRGPLQNISISISSRRDHEFFRCSLRSYRLAQPAICRSLVCMFAPAQRCAK
jgi:NADH dehydrogenase